MYTRLAYIRRDVISGTTVGDLQNLARNLHDHQSFLNLTESRSPVKQGILTFWIQRYRLPTEPEVG